MFFIILSYISLIIILNVTIWWIYYTRTKFWKLCAKIPGPKPVPIIGNILEILGPAEKLISNFLEFSQKYFPMCRFFLGNTCFVLLHDADDINTVLLSEKTRSRFVAFDILERFIGKNILTARREDWRKYRRLVNPSLKGSVLKSFVGVFNKKSEILVSILKGRCNHVFDIRNAIEAMTLDTILQVATGIDQKIQEDNKTEYITLLEEGKRYVYKCLVNPFYWFKLLFNYSEIYKYVLRAAEVQFKYALPAEKELNFCIDRSTENQISRKDAVPLADIQLGIIDHVIENMQSTCFLSRNDLMFQLWVLELAGTDSTATVLASCIKLLGFYKEVQDEIVKELCDIFGDDIGRAAQYVDLEKMVYTEQVIKETLRLFSPAHLTGRRADEDIVVGGYTLPAGTNILLSPYLVHRNPKYYPDPLKFKPERFAPENVHNRNPHTFIPFTAGPRNCVGNQYAMLAIKTTLSHILRHFEILQFDDRDMMEVNMDVTLTMKHGFNIYLKERKNLNKNSL